jgi:glycosyltransferase involved in cell wall biosynthesis
VEVTAYYKTVLLPTYAGSIVSVDSTNAAKYISIGIIAWNEERTIGPMLESIFRQSLFSELSRRGLVCEIVCVTNGCTDRTPQIVDEVFSRQERSHPFSNAFTARVIDIRDRGKIPAWNLFVHWISARETRFLFLMDADILIQEMETLWNMVLKLETSAEVSVAVDTPRKDVEFKRKKSLADHFSLAASRLTRSASAQLCAQLYCIRSEVARNIYLPRDLAACDDGLIKTLVCTDFLAHAVWPMRIQSARKAAHTFEAYTSLKSILKNQKRQMIGQTMVHILVDKYLKRLSPLERAKLGQTLLKKDQDEPEWLKNLVSDHVRECRHFWQLYPGLLTYRFRRLAELSLLPKIACFPAAFAGFLIALISGPAAFKFLKAGCTDYWPRPDRVGLSDRELVGGAVQPLVSD